jgi:hypothetical protein
MEKVRLHPDMKVAEVADLAEKKLITVEEFNNWCETISSDRKFENTNEDLDRYFEGVKSREH